MSVRLRRQIQLAMIGLIAVAAMATIAIVIIPSRPAPGQQLTYTLRPRATGADWNGYLMDATNSAYNPNEKTLSPQTMKQLRLVGMYDVGLTIPSKDSVATSVVSAGNTLYFGSWDGYEYAINATTFALRWRQFLGITTPPVAQQCFPASAGVTSNATLVNTNLYVGGGNGVMYDLDSTSGTVLWQTQIATPPNEFLWSSPLIVHGRVYIGVASYGDCPLVRGRLDMLDAASGQLLVTHYTVGPNDVGNSIWSKGVADVASNAVIFAIGNGPQGNPESQAIVAYNWDTLQMLPNGAWSIPASEVGGDSDFGASCTLVPNVGGGQHGVVCHNKNGYLYALAVSPNGLSLSWSLKLGLGGDAPEHDMGDITEAVFDGTFLYASTEQMHLGEDTHQSAVYKIDPATGAVLWISPVDNFFSLTALAGANGFLVMGLTDQDFHGAFVVLDMATGAQIYFQILSSAMLGSPSIADGEILLPTLDGHLYIYANTVEPSATAAFTHGTLPVGWRWQNGRTALSPLTSQGVQIRGDAGETPDTANFLARSLPVGDYTIEASVENPLQNGSARASLVAYASPGNFVLLSVYARNATSETFELLDYFRGKLINQSVIADPVAGAGTILLQIVQTRERYIGYSSRDGIHWLKIGDFTLPFSTILGGVSTYTPVQGMRVPATFAWCQITSLNGQ